MRIAKGNLFAKHQTWIDTIVKQCDQLKIGLKAYRYLSEGIELATELGIQVDEAELIRTNSTGLTIYNPSNLASMIKGLKNKHQSREAKILARKKYEESISKQQLASHLMYPKVFEEVMEHQNNFSDTSVLSTELFFYGPLPDKEYSLPIDIGKNLIVRYLAKGEPNANGSSSVFFELNGQPRTIEVINKEFSKNVATKIKAEEGNLNHIGSPLPGQVAKIFVHEGEKVIKGDRVVVSEAMKMETTITAEKSGTIKKLHVNSGDNVETKDLLFEIE